MPVPAMRLVRAQVDDLCKIAEMPVGAIYDVANRVAALKTIRRTVVEAAISEGGQQETTAALRRTVFGLASLGRRYFATAHEVLTSVSEALTRFGWDVHQIREWNERMSALEALLGCESVVMATKALDLTHDFAQVFVSARIITGLRPVINENRTTVAGSVITQTLRLDYASPSGEQTSLTVALDRADIERLLEACVDAQKKSSLLKKTEFGLDIIEPAEGSDQ